MKRRICLFMTILMAFSSVSAWACAESDHVESILASMSLRDKVAQMMIVSFRVWEEVPAEGEEKPEEEPLKEDITSLNDPIREMLGKNHFGGFLLFGQNYVDAEQTVRLVSDIQAANQKGGGLPQIFFTDQEGGAVSRISYGTTGVGNMALGATGDPENARIMARVHGEELALLGIQADFAPVMDINNNASNPVIGVRSFSDDPYKVADFGCAYLQGLHETGTMAALKHFPGHGNTDTDSHTGLPLINSTYEELQAFELIPFRTAIEAGADMVMTAHIQYPQIEKGTYTSISTGEQIFLPATMSRIIMTDILRGDMGFEGVIVSDALDMSAISENFTLKDTLRLTINAGLDMLILPAVTDTNLFRQVDTWVDTAVALVESGEISEERINESVRRIMTLKNNYGVLDLKDFTVTDAQIAAASKGVGSEDHLDTEWQIAERAMTLLKNENGAFPLTMKEGEKTLILFADSCASRAGAGNLVRRILEEKHLLPEGAKIDVMKNTKDNEEDCIQAAKDADHVILVHRVWKQACMDPASEDGFSSGTFDKVISTVHEAGKTVILVSCQLPYDAARFPAADAILLTYLGSAMKDLPAEGTTWAANLPAGLLSCFGTGETGGILPVNIPALDENWKPSADILWKRGQSAGHKKLDE